jgi:hypothetical protein
MTLLMTLFNVRLGWWLPNPGKPGNRVHRKSSPGNSLGALLSEAVGNTNDEYKWVYLSDGGHFENLGLYDVVMRRVGTIIVIDASADPHYEMGDLGNAFRKIYVDFGIPILIRDRCGPPIFNSANREEVRHCTIYDIQYACVHGSDTPNGTLVYIKACLCSKLSEDVKHYAGEHPAFPHEPTFNQFFKESQFESYRRLGAHSVEHILSEDPRTLYPREISLSDFVSLAEQHATRQEHKEANDKWSAVPGGSFARADRARIGD